jgi:outer membrane assembly lipoprotein YfiO
VDDSRKKLVLVDEHIAGAKMSVGRFQIKSRNYIGAIKNFQNVTYNYSKTKQAEEAYFRLFEIHRKLGLEREAISYLRQLKENYPKSIWI